MLVIEFLVAGGVAATVLFGVSAQEAPRAAISPVEEAQAMEDFNSTCAGCHGEDAGGGDRAPALVDNSHLRALDAVGIAAIIRTGQRAKPPFPTNDSWRATPMTYTVDGRQYIAGMDGQVLWAFALHRKWILRFRGSLVRLRNI